MTNIDRVKPDVMAKAYAVTAEIDEEASIILISGIVELNS